MGPFGFAHFLPTGEGLEAPVCEPLRLAFAGGNIAHYVFVQTRRKGLRLNIGDEARVIFAAGFD
jgi:hypothetical protein